MSCSADTSAILAFARIGRLDILKAILENVLLPPTVIREIIVDQSTRPGAIEVQRELGKGGWLQAVQVPSNSVLDSLRESLGNSGEAETIAVAEQLKIPALLDELKGRKAAAKAGVQVIGSLGVLKLAKRRGIIEAAKPIVTAMRESGIYYSPQLLSIFFADVGES